MLPTIMDFRVKRVLRVKIVFTSAANIPKQVNIWKKMEETLKFSPFWNEKKCLHENSLKGIFSLEIILVWNENKNKNRVAKIKGCDFHSGRHASNDNVTFDMHMMVVLFCGVRGCATLSRTHNHWWIYKWYCFENVSMQRKCKRARALLGVCDGRNSQVMTY